jgi:hypothetical protein
MPRLLYCLISIICGIPIILFFFCVNANRIVNPYDISQTKIDAWAKSSNGIVSSSSIEDSVGNIVKIGLECNWWSYVDSVQFRQVAQTSNSTKDSLLGTKFNDNVLKSMDTIWQIVIFNETGAKTVKVKVFLNNHTFLSDSITIFINPKKGTYNSLSWQKDTIHLNGSVGTSISLNLFDKVTEPLLDSLFFDLLPGEPAGDTIQSGNYSFLPMQTDTGVCFIRISARDKTGGSDTVLLLITILPTSALLDTLPPLIKLISPEKDTAFTNASSYTIGIICKDSSGIESVRATLGALSFIGSKTSDSTWTVIISNLTSTTVNCIAVTVTDNSIRANKSVDSVWIKCDPNISDSTAPLF